jgi:hypothetical protein
MIDDTTIKALAAICSLIIAVVAIPKAVLDMLATVKTAFGKRSSKKRQSANLVLSRRLYT